MELYVIGIDKYNYLHILWDSDEKEFVTIFIGLSSAESTFYSDYRYAQEDFFRLRSCIENKAYILNISPDLEIEESEINYLKIYGLMPMRKG